MPRVQRSALLTFTCEQMFALVDDIPLYPQFLPWCAAAEELSRDAREVVAKLTLRRGGLTGSFTTRNTLAHPDSIQLALVAGPFSRLSGGWQFVDIGGSGCRVSLDLSFEGGGPFARPLAMLLEAAASTMVDAFSKRAVEVYA